MELSGRKALVTGASSGLGAHFARLLASRGAEVTAAARRRDALAALCDDIGRSGGIAHGRVLDVTEADSIDAMFADRAFDIVVNNAGLSAPGDALNYPAADWDRTFDTNTRGAFLVAQGAARGMRAAGRGGAIVNVASILGRRVAGHVAAYAASKAALLQMTRALALEWARHDIRVNALCPGYIETDINRDFFASDAGKRMIRRIPQRRLGRPDDLDGALLLLVSDAGRYMTGSEIVVDGGHLVSSL